MRAFVAVLVLMVVAAVLAVGVIVAAHKVTAPPATTVPPPCHLGQLMPDGELCYPRIGLAPAMSV